MTTRTKMPRTRTAAIAIALAAFAAAFHFAHEQRRAIQPVQDRGTAFARVTLLPRAYAQAHQDLWPPLDPQTRALALPLDLLPRGYTIAPRFDSKMTEPISGMLLGTINNAAAYTLNSVDPLAGSYIYFGYAVTNEQEFRALVDAIRAGAPLTDTIAVPKGSGTLGSSNLYRLHSKLDEVLAKDGVIPTTNPAILALVPVIMERPKDGYVWVYYLARLERLPYPGPFPACREVVDAAGAIRLSQH